LLSLEKNDIPEEKKNANKEKPSVLIKANSIKRNTKLE